jgi:hypothetical protein
VQKVDIKSAGNWKRKITIPFYSEEDFWTYFETIKRIVKQTSFHTFTYLFFCSTTLFAQNPKSLRSKRLLLSIDLYRCFLFGYLTSLGQAYENIENTNCLCRFRISIYSYTLNQETVISLEMRYKEAFWRNISDPNHPIYGNLDDARLIVLSKNFKSKKQRLIFMLLTVGIYILNIVDANADAHLIQFTVNDNLSIKVR